MKAGYSWNFIFIKQFLGKFLSPQVSVLAENEKIMEGKKDHYRGKEERERERGGRRYRNRNQTQKSFQKFSGRYFFRAGEIQKIPSALFSETSNAKLFRNCDARRIRLRRPFYDFPLANKERREGGRKGGQIDVRDSPGTVDVLSQTVDTERNGRWNGRISAFRRLGSSCSFFVFSVSQKWHGCMNFDIIASLIGGFCCFCRPRCKRIFVKIVSHLQSAASAIFVIVQQFYWDPFDEVIPTGSTHGNRQRGGDFRSPA